MTRNNESRHDMISREIGRQIRGEQMKRFIASLPAFAANPDIPESMAKLLRKLDRVETSAPSKSR